MALIPTPTLLQKWRHMRRPKLTTFRDQSDDDLAFVATIPVAGRLCIHTAHDDAEFFFTATGRAFSLWLVDYKSTPLPPPGRLTK